MSQPSHNLRVMPARKAKRDFRNLHVIEPIAPASTPATTSVKQQKSPVKKKLAQPRYNNRTLHVIETETVPATVSSQAAEAFPQQPNSLSSLGLKQVSLAKPLKGGISIAKRVVDKAKSFLGQKPPVRDNFRKANSKTAFKNRAVKSQQRLDDFLVEDTSSVPTNTSTNISSESRNKKRNTEPKPHNPNVLKERDAKRFVEKNPNEDLRRSFSRDRRERGSFRKYLREPEHSFYPRSSYEEERNETGLLRRSSRIPHSSQKEMYFEPYKPYRRDTRSRDFEWKDRDFRDTRPYFERTKKKYKPRYDKYPKVPENLEEVSDGPLDDDFEEVEVASVEEAGKSTSIPIGFSKYSTRYLGFKRGFFKPKWFHIASKRTVISCINIKETKAVESNVTDQNADSLKDKVSNKKTDPVKEEVLNEKGDFVKDKALNKKADPVKDEVLTKKANTVKEKDLNKKSDPVKDEVSNKKANIVKDKVSNKMANIVKDEVSNKMANIAKDEVANKTADPVKDKALNKIADPVKDEVSNKKNNYVEEKVSNQKADSFNEKVSNKKDDPAEEKISDKIADSVKVGDSTKISNDINDSKTIKTSSPSKDIISGKKTDSPESVVIDKKDSVEISVSGKADPVDTCISETADLKDNIDQTNLEPDDADYSQETDDELCDYQVVDEQLSDCEIIEIEECNDEDDDSSPHEMDVEDSDDNLIDSTVTSKEKSSDEDFYVCATDFSSQNSSSAAISSDVELKTPDETPTEGKNIVNKIIPMDVDDEIKQNSRTYSKSSSKKTETKEFCQGFAKIQSYLDSWQSHLIGMEYIIEVQDNFIDRNVKKYHCWLCGEDIWCEKMLGQTVIGHVNSYKHMLDYLAKHFPSCSYKFSESVAGYNSEFVLRKCCEEVNNKIGYYLMYITNCDYFSNHLAEIKELFDSMIPPAKEDINIDANVHIKELESATTEIAQCVIKSMLDKISPVQGIETFISTSRKPKWSNVSKDILPGIESLGMDGTLGSRTLIDLTPKDLPETTTVIINTSGPLLCVLPDLPHMFNPPPINPETSLQSNVKAHGGSLPKTGAEKSKPKIFTKVHSKQANSLKKYCSLASAFSSVKPSKSVKKSTKETGSKSFNLKSSSNQSVDSSKTDTSFLTGSKILSFVLEKKDAPQNSSAASDDQESVDLVLDDEGNLVPPNVIVNEPEISKESVKKNQVSSNVEESSKLAEEDKGNAAEVIFLPEKDVKEVPNEEENQDKNVGRVDSDIEIIESDYIISNNLKEGDKSLDTQAIIQEKSIKKKISPKVENTKQQPSSHQKSSTHSKYCIKRIISRTRMIRKRDDNSLDLDSVSEDEDHITSSTKLTDELHSQDSKLSSTSSKRKRSPSSRSSRSPSLPYNLLRALSKSPSRSPIKSPIRLARRRSRSPYKSSKYSGKRRSRSPSWSKNSLRKKSRSPFRIRSRSRSPIRRRSRSPFRRQSRSPIWRTSRNLQRKRSRSPIKRRSRSPGRRRSRSPVKSSRFQHQDRSRSPYKKLVRRSSRSPLRRKSKSPIKTALSPKRHSSSDLRNMERLRTSRWTDASLRPESSSLSKARSSLHPSLHEQGRKSEPGESSREFAKTKEPAIFSKLKNTQHLDEIMKLPQSTRLMVMQILDKYVGDNINANETKISEFMQLVNRNSSVLQQGGDMMSGKQSQASMSPNAYYQQQLLASLSGSSLKPNVYSATPGNPYAASMSRIPQGVPPPYQAPSLPTLLTPNLPPSQGYSVGNVTHSMSPMNYPSGSNAPLQGHQYQPNVSSIVQQNVANLIQQPAKPPEVMFKDLKATVNKLFGPKDTNPGLGMLNESPGFPPKHGAGKWEQVLPTKSTDRYPQESQSQLHTTYSSNFPKQSSPQFSAPPPDTKVSFCDKPSAASNRNLFPVVSKPDPSPGGSSVGRGAAVQSANVNNAKISLAQRLAAVLVKYGMMDVSAALLQEMLMKIGAFSSNPPQDINEREIVDILKRLGYLL